jgi:hypothetical protein
MRAVQSWSVWAKGGCAVGEACGGGLLAAVVEG